MVGVCYMIALFLTEVVEKRSFWLDGVIAIG